MPALIDALRERFYARPAPIANRWHQSSGLVVRFPDRHADFLARYHTAGQERPTPLLLRGFARPSAAALWADLPGVFEQAPLRHMVTSGSFRMSVAMSNCGALGWVSGSTGYRYVSVNPENGRRWPAMAAFLSTLATLAAARVGFAGFEPDACLINRYEPGARLTLHQDHNERDFSQPIVSVSLGLPSDSSPCAP